MRGREVSTADVNGTRLHYELQGEGDGPAIVLCHGFTLDHRMWSGQVEILAQRHRVLSYDSRGFGKSDVPPAGPYSHWEDAAALCAHLGLRRIVVVGHSIGGHHMLELAVSRPDLVAGYVGVCTSGLAGIPFPDEVKEMFRAIRAAARDGRIDEAKHIWSRSGWIGPAHQDAAVEDAMAAMLADYSGWHFVHDDPVVRIAPPAAERLAGLAIPALVVTGAQDLAYNEEVAQTLATNIPGACRLPLAGTHMVSMEEPARVAAAIDQIACRAA
jgi:pimeloyl-ACP methyl ester carboxylesterase